MEHFPKRAIERQPELQIVPVEQELPGGKPGGKNDVPPGLRQEIIDDISNEEDEEKKHREEIERRKIRPS